MDKRLAKRHKRQVERAKEKVKLSEPDLRTHEQIEAARAASRPDSNRGSNQKVAMSGQSVRRNVGTGSAAKTDA
jgi:hypothetical protein